MVSWKLQGGRQGDKTVNHFECKHVKHNRIRSNWEWKGERRGGGGIGLVGEPDSMIAIDTKLVEFVIDLFNT